MRHHRPRPQATAALIPSLLALLLASCGSAFTSGEAGGSGGLGATGGAAVGGSQVGGAGTAGAGADGGALSHPPECAAAEDCKLIDDCCNCVAVPLDETAPGCGVTECGNEQPCVVSGVHAADPLCEAGRCAAGFDCDHLKVNCSTTAPDCGSTSDVPSVIGNCWSGACVAPTECSYVAASEICTSRGLVAVTVVAATDERIHCVAPFEQCGSNANCWCLGSSVCADAPCFDAGPGRISCRTQ